MSFRLTKNWLVALLGLLVRAIERVPRAFLSPFRDSLAMGALVGFCTDLVSKPPPWITKFGMTRWKTVPS